jgi:catechol 2,3-dioxygenase-like lactoylglutathione lyase family enzyme
VPGPNPGRAPAAGHGDKADARDLHYDPPAARPTTAVNRPGFAHIAFAVDDVATARDAVIAAGGSTVGEEVSLKIPGAGTVTFVYVADPEGNIIELQNWSGHQASR